MEIIDVADVNQWRCLEESGQWLENADPSHQIVASGKPVLQKTNTKVHFSGLRRVRHHDISNVSFQRRD